MKLLYLLVFFINITFYIYPAELKEARYFMVHNSEICGNHAMQWTHKEKWKQEENLWQDYPCNCKEEYIKNDIDSGKTIIEYFDKNNQTLQTEEIDHYPLTLEDCKKLGAKLENKSDNIKHPEKGTIDYFLLSAFSPAGFGIKFDNNEYHIIPCSPSRFLQFPLEFGVLGSIGGYYLSEGDLVKAILLNIEEEKCKNAILTDINYKNISNKTGILFLGIPIELKLFIALLGTYFIYQRKNIAFYFSKFIQNFQRIK